MLDHAARSPDPSICPFLRRDIDGELSAPGAEPTLDQSCVAIGAARPQSLRQQELVCLRAAHADCPRYLRGAMATVPVVVRKAAPTVPRATVAALLILVLSAGISFGFVVQRGGIAMPVVEAAPTDDVAVVTSPTPGATSGPVATPSPAPESPSADPVVSPSTSSEPTPSPSPTPTPTPSPAPTATPERTPRPTPRPTRKPTGERYRLLTACPNRDNCWIYTVRSGDNLYSIANYYGHSLATIYDWNPQYPDKSLRVGAQIRMPPPTR